MKNLVAVRGTTVGERMYGPTDYYGNLENPHLYRYTVDINDNGIPHVRRRSRSLSPTAVVVIKRRPVETDYLRLRARWQSGVQSNNGESLFPVQGTLILDMDMTGATKLLFPRVDARQLDLSIFLSNLVRNGEPFSLIDQPLPSADYFRLIRYVYEPKYASAQVNNGGGLFLEQHGFAQFITPLSKEACSGFVVLGHWSNPSLNELNLIAVHIPFGYTLVVHPFAIHGDATLIGPYLMGMTSNHVTMSTADTVFVRDTLDRNIAFELSPTFAETNVVTVADDLVIMDDMNEQEVDQFRKRIQTENLIFNPISRAYRRLRN
jgi:hypothetical protein